MAVQTARIIYIAANTRYDNDTEFHFKCHTAMNILSSISMVDATTSDWDTAMRGVVVALYLADIPIKALGGA